MCDNYHWGLSFGMIAAGEFCQYNKSSAGGTSPFSQRKSADGWGDNCSLC